MVEQSEFQQVSSMPVGANQELCFYTYSLGKMRLGSVRVFKHTRNFWGPTRSGIDGRLDQLQELTAVLERLSAEYEQGRVIPPVEFARVPCGRNAEWIVQLLADEARPERCHLDVRKYVITETYVGFTKKGLRVSVDLLDVVVEQLPHVCRALLDWREGRSGLFAAESGEEPDEAPFEPPAEAVPDEYSSFF